MLMPIPVRVASIDPSPLNPRKVFDPAAMQRLQESIGRRGIDRPLRLRPGHSADRYEIVCGERRWRAARALALAEVPATVQVLTDAQVLEAQLEELLTLEEWEAVGPLEEAEAFALLHSRFEVSIDTIATRIQRSPTYVYERLGLARLSQRAQAAFRAGRLALSAAVSLSRLGSQSLQDRALAELAPKDRTEPLPVDEARAILRQKFQVRLADAPFSLEDAQLLPGAGPCTTCPHNSARQLQLFEDPGAGAFCTDPPCLERKKEAFRQRTAAAARKAGQPVLSPPEAAAIFDAGGQILGPYVDLESRCMEDAQGRTYADLLAGRVAVPSCLAFDPMGKARQLLPKAALPKVLRQAEVPAPPSRRPWSERVHGQLAIEARKEEATAALRAQVATQIEAKGGRVLPKVHWLLCRDLLLQAPPDSAALRRRDLIRLSTLAWADGVLEDLSEAQRVALLVELYLEERAEPTAGLLSQFCDWLGIHRGRRARRAASLEGRAS